MSEVIHETPILYKKTSTGKIQQWRAWVEQTDDGFLLKVESGQTDGRKTETAGQENKSVQRVNKPSLKQLQR